MAIVLENSSIKILIHEKGAELASLFHKKNATEYLWQANPQYWNRHAPLLFPIIGKLNNDTTIIKDKPYHMTQHGFARDCIFETSHTNEGNVLLKLKSNSETQLKYPYEFELLAEYRLKDTSVEIFYTVNNPSTENIYFSFGLHPAFLWPIHPTDTKENYFLEFEKNETADRILFDAGFITGEKTPWLKNQNKINLYDQLFENDVLIFKNLNSKKITLRSNEHKKFIEVEFAGYPYLGIWTKPGNPFICIEPWYGIADNKNDPQPFSKKEGVLQLEPHQSFQCSVKYTIG